MTTKLKERPLCRSVIEHTRLYPRVINGVWDGRSGVLPDGTVITRKVPNDMHRQMRRMIIEGYWPGVRAQ